MSIEITPRGTRGRGMPRFPGPLMAAMNGMQHLMVRAMGGRMRVKGRPLLELQTVGARSGKPRRSVLGWFPDTSSEEGRLVVASFGGSERHPAWFLNLARHPDDVWVEIGRERTRVRATSLRGEEREKAWRRIVELAPGYADYQAQTDREIPVVRLTPA